MSPDENQDLTVVGNPDRGEVVAIILHPESELDRREVRGSSRIDVPSSTLNGDPGYPIHVLGRDHFRRVGRAQHVFEREVLPGGGGVEEKTEQKNEEEGFG
jgi:hypothetical protein